MNENHDRLPQLLAGLLIWATVILTVPLLILLGDAMPQSWPQGYLDQVKLLALCLGFLFGWLTELVLVCAGFLAFERALTR